MLNRLTLILRPAISYHAQIKKILLEEHFDHQFATLVTGIGADAVTEDVVLVTCVDFHDVGVVTSKLTSRINPKMYLVDATQSIFSYDSHNRKLETLGQLYAGSSLAMNKCIAIGNNTFTFWETK